MKVALQHFGSSGWMAGNWFIQNLVLALRSLGSDCPRLELIVSDKTVETDYEMLRGLVDDVLLADFSPPPPPPKPPWRDGGEGLRAHTLRVLRHRMLGRRPPTRPPRPAHPLARLLPERGVDCYFSLAWRTEPLTSAPHITWLSDFQHRRLPELFSAPARAKRDEIFRRQAESAAIVMVTSEEVRRDFERFAPAQSAKGRTIRFVAAIDPTVYATDPGPALARYHLPEKFFYLPNQFWQHKNHLVVVAALERLRAKGLRPVVVCSGGLTEYRRPEYVGQFIQQLSLADVRDQLILLGHVPRADVFALMRQSVAVLNSSLFEGLGMSVAEAHSLGKRLLLSNLPALREQRAPCADYFDPANAEELAAKMALIWEDAKPGPDMALERQARAELTARQQAFGRAFITLVEEAIQLWPTPA
jgi:glycosyltransferase involved in cell wall biosynthesis